MMIIVVFCRPYFPLDFIPQGSEKSTSSPPTEEKKISVVEHTDDELEASKYFH